MRFFLAVLLAANVATAALPPKPELRTYDVSELVGTNGFFATAEELLTVTRAFLKSSKYALESGVKTPSAELKDSPLASLVVYGMFDVQDEMKGFLDTFRKLKERRKLVVEVESLLFTADAGFGELALLPKEGDKPVVLTVKEATLTERVVRLKKADGTLDIVSRPRMMLTHGQAGTVSIGQRFPEVTARTANTDGSVTAKVSYADVGLSHKLTATVLDGGGVKLTGSVSHTEVANEKARVTHRGEFTAEVPVGGTVVARIPTLTPTGTEMYLMLTVKGVCPAVAKTADVGEKFNTNQLPPLPNVAVPPMPGGIGFTNCVPPSVAPPAGPSPLEKLATRSGADCDVCPRTRALLPLPTLPKAGVQVWFVTTQGEVFIPAGTFEQSQPLLRLTRTPWGTVLNAKPKAAETEFWGGCPFGLKFEY